MIKVILSFLKTLHKCVFGLLDQRLIKKNKKNIFLWNINYDPSRSSQKTILISYHLKPFFQSLSESSKKTTSSLRSMQIIKCFSEFGFVIDLVDCTLEQNSELVFPRNNYDLIFGLGWPFFKASNTFKSAKKIMYCVELHPKYTKPKLQERVAYFKKRHPDINIASSRSYKYYKPEFFEGVDYGILQGNSYTSKAYDGCFKKLFLVSTVGMHNSNYIHGRRNLSSSKKNFLWFGSKGAVHKGLDVVVDSFAGLPDLNLYICGVSTKEKFLIRSNYNNITDLGFIDVYSDKFISLVNHCSFLIFPSCSEGMPTSVLTLMRHGVIPLVTKETGINLEGFGEYILDVNVDVLRKQILGVSNWDNSTLDSQHNLVFNHSNSQFTFSTYRNNICKIISDLV